MHHWSLGAAATTTRPLHALHGQGQCGNVVGQGGQEGVTVSDGRLNGGQVPGTLPTPSVSLSSEKQLAPMVQQKIGGGGGGARWSGVE